jgi:uncharacterized protein
MKQSPYVPRLTDSKLSSLIRAVPAVMVTGPRACGKTTSAMRFAADVIRLDDPQVADAVRANPDAVLRQAVEPLLIDEWQEVPAILGAIKRSVDINGDTGRFILTGSVEASLTAAMWPGTGRVINLVLETLTQREITSGCSGTGLLPQLIAGNLDAISARNLQLDDYLGLAIQSGFPEPVFRLDPITRTDWLESYLDHVVARDVKDGDLGRDPIRLRRYLEVLGLSTSGLPNEATLTAAAGLNHRTAVDYDKALRSLYLIDHVPAWSTNRLTQLNKGAKRYFSDAGLAMAAARVNLQSVMRNGDLMGRMLDTFVAQQLRPEVALLQPKARLHHLRTEGGRQEIDLIIDLGPDQIIGIEIKATSAPTRRDAKHLMWLRERLGEKMIRGVVFHTGRFPYELDERIWALPISALWS